MKTNFVKSEMKFYIIFLFVVFGILYNPTGVQTQKKSERKTNVKEVNSFEIGQEQNVATCEYIKHAFDMAFADSEKLPNDVYLITILRLGRKESKTLNKSRIDWIQRYIEHKGFAGKYVVAETSAHAESGSIELYIEGKLKWNLLLEKKIAKPCSIGDF